jgi:hypothetical protein
MRDAAYDTILPAKIIIDEKLVPVTLRKDINEMAENAGVHPIVLDLAINLDRLALAFKPKPRLPRFNVYMILQLRKGKRTLCHFHHPLSNSDVAALALDTLSVEMPKVFAMRSPWRFLLGHAEANEGQIVAGFVESFPPPTVDEVGNSELVLQFQTAFGKSAELFFDGHMLVSSLAQLICLDRLRGLELGKTVTTGPVRCGASFGATSYRVQ